jgi:antitoxin component YwqK of YwqJK toxin-antitoxin module
MPPAPGMNSNRSRFPELIAALGILGLAATVFLFLHRQPPKAIRAPAPEVPRHDLVQTDGRWYRSGETNPFTGIMVDYHSEGILRSRSQMSNGLLNGVSETWYTNGQMQVRECFKDSISNGLRQKWYPNGFKQSQATIVAGKVVGTFQSWHENGQLSEQIPMLNGQPDGTAWAYYPSGFVKAETAVDHGKILSRKSWRDGEHRQASVAEISPAVSKAN